MYLISCLDLPESNVLDAYEKMSASSIGESLFYLLLRKNSRLVRQTGSVFHTYPSSLQYSQNEPTSKIKLVSSDDQALQVLFGETQEEFNKIGIGRNRDFVIIEVEE